MKMHRVSLLLACSAIGLARNVFDNEAGPYSVATVTIETENGPVRINASDYDEKTHKLAKGEPKPVAPETLGANEAPPPPAPVTTPVPHEPAPGAPSDQSPPAVVSPGVLKEGSKWFVVDMNADNAKIGDANGYPSQAKANEAAQALVPAPAA